MGQKASDTRGITFEDVVIPKEVCIIIYMTSIQWSVQFAVVFIIMFKYLLFM